MAEVNASENHVDPPTNAAVSTKPKRARNNEILAKEKDSERENADLAKVKSEKPSKKEKEKAKSVKKEKDRTSKRQDQEEKRKKEEKPKAREREREKGGKAKEKASKKDDKDKDEERQKRSRSKKDKEAKQQKSKAKTKVIVRRLPPNLPEQVFWSSVSAWVRDAAQARELKDAIAANQDRSASSSMSSLDQTIDYKAYVPGKLRPSNVNKENVHSRAYIRFLNPAQVVEFHKGFDGHIFRDSKGNESVAVVEFSPYQKVPTEKRRKQDAKQGTIDDEAEYLAFVKSLEASNMEKEENKTDAQLMAHLTSQPDKEAIGKSTPLLEHLRAQKALKAEAAAMAAAKAYRNPYKYQYPDAKPAASASKSSKASSKAAKMAEGSKKAMTADEIKRLKIQQRRLAKAEALQASASSVKDKAATAASEKSSDTKAQKSEASKKTIRAAAIAEAAASRAFGAALSGALGSVAKPSKGGKGAKADGKEKGKENEKAGAARIDDEPDEGPGQSPSAAPKGPRGKGSKADVASSSALAKEREAKPSKRERERSKKGAGKESNTVGSSAPQPQPGKFMILTRDHHTTASKEKQGTTPAPAGDGAPGSDVPIAPAATVKGQASKAGDRRGEKGKPPGGGGGGRNRGKEKKSTNSQGGGRGGAIPGGDPTS